MDHTYSPNPFGKSVNTLQQWDRKGILPAFGSPTNRRSSTHAQYLQSRGLISSEQGLVMASARVSSPGQKKELLLQIEHIELGLVKRAVIGSQDRVVRFGYDWVEQVCQRHGTHITGFTGEPFSPQEEFVRDLMAIVPVFCARRPHLRSHTHLIRAAALGKDLTDEQHTQDPTASYA